jgi:hypothetical protein
MTEALMQPNYEAWRQALAAFYRADCCFQSAENVARGSPLTNADRRIIEGLILAGERAPRKAA